MLFDNYMRQALDLARDGLALASPNPYVGAVIVDSGGLIVGTGSHTYDGIKHAEVLALEQAGPLARSSTLIVNLEPCCHQGRTAPCTDAIIHAGVKRVVVAMADPNPQVGGSGLAKLRSAGIEVVLGVREAEAKKLNESFAKFILTGTPLVTLKSGMTLDGKIASSDPEGDTKDPETSNLIRHWITSSEARAHVHGLRHANDAILVGIGTVMSDDPLLTDRSGLRRRRPLLRVVLDSKLQISISSQLVQTADEDVIIFCVSANEEKQTKLKSHGVRVESLPPPDLSPRRGKSATNQVTHQRPDIKSVMTRLAELEITSTLIEGGALINWAALQAEVVDKIFFYYAPKLVGGSNAVPFAEGKGAQSISAAVHVRNLTLHRFSEDFAVEGYLHDPYESQINHFSHFSASRQ